jgi:hypothetical protein
MSMGNDEETITSALHLLGVNIDRRENLMGVELFAYAPTKESPDLSAFRFDFRNGRLVELHVRNHNPDADGFWTISDRLPIRVLNVE